MDKTLFIGNGLNRTLQDITNWDSLMQEIAKELNIEHIPGILLPLEFERIINCYLDNSDNPSNEVYNDIKKDVCQKLESLRLPPSAIHHKIIELELNSIITTNYDCLMEQVYDSSYNFDPKSRKKYLFNKTGVIDNVSFYHPHGIVSNSESICLGYEHYAGIVEKLRKELNTKEQSEKSKMAIKQILCGEKNKKSTWGELFYTNNIYIVGFNLDFCEIDIWWLLTHRAYLYYSNYFGVKDKIANRIVCYDIVDDIEKENSKNEQIRLGNQETQKLKHKLLEGYHVIVKKYNLSDYNNNYSEVYLNIIMDIKGDQ